MKNLIRAIFILIMATVVSSAGAKKIVVDLTKQEAYAYNGKQLVCKGWISSGKRKFESPRGVFTVLAKEKMHISNEWPKPSGGAKMPYMLRITWSGVALYSGYTPNKPASHGCIRLQKSFAKQLYNWARVGTKVVVKGKAPRRVARRGKGFISYFKLAKNSKKTKALKIDKSTYKVAYKQRAKLMNRYSKLSYKKLNQLLKKGKLDALRVAKSTKYSRYQKLKKIKEIKGFIALVKDAKWIKYKRYHPERFASKKGARKYKKITFKKVNFSNSVIGYKL